MAIVALKLTDFSLFQSLLVYTSLPETLNWKRLEETQTTDLKPVSDSCLNDYITSKGVAEYLFPSGRIVVDFVPFKLFASNVPLMRAPNNFTQIFSDVRVDNGKPTGLLSIGTLYSAKDSTGICITEIYGTDISSMKRHVAAHLKRVSYQVSIASNIVVLFDTHIPRIEIDNIFSDFGVKRYTWRDPNKSFTDHFLFNKQLEF